LTKDYTKLFQKQSGAQPKAVGKPASAPLSLKARLSKNAEYICTHCYQEGTPIEFQKGSWLHYLLLIWIICGGIFLLCWFLTGSVLISLLGAAIGLVSPINLGVKNPLSAKQQMNDDETSASLSNAMPTKILKCRKCKHPNSMVKIDSQQGQDALYFATKKETTGEQF
jgi:hypothetical protein